MRTFQHIENSLLNDQYSVGLLCVQKQLKSKSRLVSHITTRAYTNIQYTLCRRILSANWHTLKHAVDVCIHLPSLMLFASRAGGEGDGNGVRQEEEKQKHKKEEDKEGRCRSLLHLGSLFIS